MIPTPRFHRGFSLIELMCSMAIGATILVAAAALLGTSGEGYERVGGGVAAEREARALMTQLSTDLSTALYHEDAVIEQSGATWPTDRIGFLSLQPKEAQVDTGYIGDLCSVTYYIEDLPIGGKTVRCLMRGFRDSAPTFKALETDTVDSLFIKQPKTDEPVAFGVVSFEARPKKLDGDGKWVDWAKNGDAAPGALEVKLVVARRDLTGKLVSAADWNGSGTSGQLLGTPDKTDRNKNLEIYGTLIRFGNHATP